MKTIYITEDHDVIRNGVVQYLALSGYDAKGFSRIEECRKAFQEKVPDLLIQDVMLPDGDGFSFVKEVKKEHEEVAVIFLTARVDESDRILGFELGADDYITKPFSPKELVLRVDALFRRIDQNDGSKNGSVNKYTDGEAVLEINEDIHEATLDGEKIVFTAAEWRILTYLIKNSPSLISRSKIIEDCFDYSFDSYERVVDTHIKNIRTKLKSHDWIDTVRGYGYKFIGKRV